MTNLLGFIKRELVFVVSSIIAAATLFLVPIDSKYLEYIDPAVLIMLFCLMATVAGFKKYGGFDLFSMKLLLNEQRKKYIPAVLVMICFFFSMAVTNDVVLITFVPLTIYMIKDTSSSSLIYVVIMETLAANLGSLVTPVGNPQNLFLYHYYDMNIVEFLNITLPLGLVSLAIITILLFIMPSAQWEVPKDISIKRINRKRLLLYCTIFLICILSILKIIGYGWCLLIVVVSLVLWDRNVFSMVDYWLLLTFVNFFIIVGNLSRIECINRFVSEYVMGQELLSGVVVSQFISNVPAAIMLAPFTENFRELILGVNIGGLGTPIASLASLISFKYYSIARGASKGKYIMIFTVINLIVLMILIWIFN